MASTRMCPTRAPPLPTCSKTRKPAPCYRRSCKTSMAFREPLILFYWEGRSTKEVAQRLGLSVSAVEQRLSRGRRRIKAEVEDRVDRALQDAKPDKKFSAGVLAAIDLSPGPATAVARPILPIVVGMGVVALGLAAWATSSIGTPDAADPTTHAAAVPAGQGGVLPPADRHSVTETQAVASARTNSNSEPISSSPMASAPEEIADDLEMESFPYRVVVNLRGGLSSMREDKRKDLASGSALPFNEDGPIAGPPHRAISGTVTDESGTPIGDAAVVAGSSLWRSRADGPFDELSGQAGAMTDAQGRFSFEAPTRPLLITAAAGTHGFATPEPVAQGEGPVDLDLVVRGTATVEGDLTFEGAPVPGVVALMMSDDTANAMFTTQIETDEGGHYRGTLLPPGRYLLAAQANVDGMVGWEGDQGPNTKVEVELVAGQPLSHDVDFKRGVTIEFRATKPGPLDYYAFAGLETTDWNVAREMLSSPTMEGSMVGATPDDPESFGVIEGLPAKVMTVCAVRPHELFAQSSYAACKVLPEPSANATLTVTFDPPAFDEDEGGPVDPSRVVRIDE